MSVDLHTKTQSWVGAESSLLISFFDTITYNLEDSDRGSRFPYIAKELYYGELQPHNVDKALKELQQIEKEFSKLKPTCAVWDIEDLQKQPPWGDNISKDITNLTEYFTTVMGENLLDIVRIALQDAKKNKSSLVLR